MRSGFIQECEYREFPSGDTNKNAWCGLLGGHAGNSVGTNPMQCARCRIKGEIDGMLVKSFLANHWLSQLNKAAMGFAESQEEIENVVVKAWEHMKDLPKFRKNFEVRILDMIELKRLSKDRVAEMAKSELKGLIEDETQ